MNEVQQPLTGEALLARVKELNSLSRREAAKLCGYYEVTGNNQTRARLTDFYKAVLSAKEEQLRSRPELECLTTLLERENLTSRAQLIDVSRMSCGDVKTLNVSTPPVNHQNYSDRDINAYFDQGFVWHPNFIGFKTRNNIGGCWVQAYVSESLSLEPDTERAIVVPYRVSDENYFYLSDDNLGEHVDLKSGQYQLLYQNRRLSNDEIESLGDEFDYFDPEDGINPESSRPELCLLTFIPTTEVIKPQILRSEPGFNPPSELIVFDEPMPQH